MIYSLCKPSYGLNGGPKMGCMSVYETQNLYCEL